MNMRRELRLACALITLLIFGYLVEIFIMGAPDFRKHSDRNYDREKDPVPFWSQFAAFGIVGAAFAYLSINWKTGLFLIETVEEHDQKRISSMREENAKRIEKETKGPEL